MVVSEAERRCEKALARMMVAMKANAKKQRARRRFSRVESLGAAMLIAECGLRRADWGMRGVI